MIIDHSVNEQVRSGNWMFRVTECLLYKDYNNRFEISFMIVVRTASGLERIKRGANLGMPSPFFCYEIIMFGRVTHARRHCKARALSVYLAHILS